MKPSCLLLALFIPALAFAGPDPRLDAPKLGSRAAVLLDAATGVVLYAKNGDEEIPPASLAKLMTIHIALTEAEARSLSPEERWDLPRESWARNQPPRSSLMRIGPGHRANLRELLLGLAIPSGNDAAVAVALRFYPTVEGFVQRMNEEAQHLDLTRTRFVEPSGISEDNLTTAREFARFCREYLRLHPETLESLHSVREFPYPTAANLGDAFQDRPNTLTLYNHNSLLGRVAGVDGLKTGYIDEAGYNIALTAERGDSRFIAVVLGAPAEYGGDRIRDADGERLLEWAFAHYKTLRPPAPVIAPVRVWKGREQALELVPGEDLACTTLSSRGEELRWELAVLDPVIAPVAAGDDLGQLILFDQEGELRRLPLLAAVSVEPGGFFKRLWDTLRLFLRSVFH